MKKHLLELAQKDEHTRRRFVRYISLWKMKLFRGGVNYNETIAQRT